VLDNQSGGGRRDYVNKPQACLYTPIKYFIYTCGFVGTRPRRQSSYITPDLPLLFRNYSSKSSPDLKSRKRSIRGRLAAGLHRRHLADHRGRLYQGHRVRLALLEHSVRTDKTRTSGKRPHVIISDAVRVVLPHRATHANCSADSGRLVVLGRHLSVILDDRLDMRPVRSASII
jgi:hypothetical protein